MSKDIATSHTLLSKALDLSDEGAWVELIEEYENFIYFILRRNNVNDSDIEDVAQEIKLELCDHLKDYDRTKGRFRAWLAVIIRTKSAQYFRKSKALLKKVNHYKTQNALLFSDNIDEIDHHIEQEWKDFIVLQALKALEDTYRDKVIEVFKRGLRGESVQETSKALGITENTVYCYRQRVKKRLKSSVKQLVLDLEGTSQ